MNTNIIITNISITDQQFTIEYVASDVGVVGRVRIPFDSPMDESSIMKYISSDLEKIKDKIEMVQKLKKTYADKGFKLEL